MISGLPSKLSRAHRLMTASNAAGYSSNFTAFWPSGESRLINKVRPQRSWDYLFESAGPGCTYVLHASLALQLQQLVRDSGKRLLGVDYHDWLTYAFVRHQRLPWVIDSCSRMQYRQHAHNQIGVIYGVLFGYGHERCQRLWFRAGFACFGFDWCFLVVSGKSGIT